MPDHTDLVKEGRAHPLLIWLRKECEGPECTLDFVRALL